MSARPIHALAAACALTSLGLPARGAAFSDPSMFARSTLAAGGGGRWFTGSPADGYSCNVCHEGGREPRLKVTGLPLEGYRPAVSYEVVVTWESAVDKFGTALEFTDTQGRRAGSLRLPPPDETQPAEFCEPASDALLAASLIEPTGGRQIISVPDCGAKRLRFLWTAPTTNVGDVWFSGSAVWSDGQADPYHDGVTEYGRVVSAAGVASVTNVSCALQPHPARVSWWLATFSGLIGLGVQRRRSRKRRQ